MIQGHGAISARGKSCAVCYFGRMARQSKQIGYILPGGTIKNFSAGEILNFHPDVLHQDNRPI